MLAGCKEFLVEEPILSQSTEITLSTYNGLDASVAGAYSPLASSTWYGAFYVLNSEMRAGNAAIPTNTDFTSGRMLTAKNLSYSSDNTSGLWGFGYFVISAANNVIDNLEGKESSDVTAQDINNLKAECLFLRALAHFDIVRLYATSYVKGASEAGIPVILKTDASGQEMPARNTVAEVYDQIIADLLEAESIIDPDYVRADVADEYSVATLSAIQALLSRAYLYTQNWQGAADYATKVINSGKYNLWSATELPLVWGQDVPTSGEIIFEIYGSQPNSYDGWWSGPSHMTNPKGYADCAAHNDLTSLYEAGDVRGTLFRTDANAASGSLWTTKYIGKGLGDAVSKPDVNNVVVLRLSEMYLNRAEAIVNGATISGVTALSDLNAIRSIRGASQLTSAGVGTVLLERRLELAFEGHYWFDLARTNSPSTRSDLPLSANDFRFVLPIPQREIETNSNLVQNTGY